MENNKMTLMGVFVIVGLSAAWALGMFSGMDPQVAELEKMRDENIGRMDQMSDQERRDQWGNFRDRIGELTEAQKKQFFESSRPIFQKMMLDRMNKFLEMSPEEQNEKLDEIIDRMEQRKASRDADGQGRGQGGPGGNRKNMSDADRDQRRKEMLDKTTPEMRAKFDKFKDMLNDRREERGLDPIEGGRGMFRAMRK